MACTLRSLKFTLAVMDHLEEAVQQGWLAVLNHDVPNFHLHAAAFVT